MPISGKAFSNLLDYGRNNIRESAPIFTKYMRSTNTPGSSSSMRYKHAEGKANTLKKSSFLASCKVASTASLLTYTISFCLHISSLSSRKGSSSCFILISSTKMLVLCMIKSIIMRHRRYKILARSTPHLPIWKKKPFSA